MKELRLEIEELEERIAPHGCHGWENALGHMNPDSQGYENISARWEEECATEM